MKEAQGHADQLLQFTFHENSENEQLYPEDLAPQSTLQQYDDPLNLQQISLNYPLTQGNEERSKQ